MAIHRKSYTWQRVRYALSRLAEQETGLASDAPAGTNEGGVVWVDDDQGPLVKPYVSVQKITGRNLGFADDYQRECVGEQRVTITQTTIGEFVVLDLIWSEVRLTATSADPAVTRDAFLIACQARVAETQEPLIFASDGVADILVTAKEFAIPDIEAVQGLTVVPVTVADLKIKSVTRIYRVRFQFYGFPLNGDDASDEFVSEMQTSLETKEGLEFLKPYGVGVQGPPSTAQDVTIQSGALRERRVFFDVDIVTRRTTYDSRGVDWVESVDPPVIEGAFV